MDEIVIPDLSLQPLAVVQRHVGGFGEVLIVRAMNGRAWALKKLREEAGVHPLDLAHEVEVLAQIPRHTHVVPVLGVVRVLGRPWMLMDYWPETLRSLLNSGALDIASATVVLGQIASGLAHIHEAGVLHLDLKPENVLIASDGTCAISDFGIARLVFERSPGELPREVFVSSVAGTPAYMSPEQFTSSRLTAACDVWTFGVIAYEALTGRHPFRAPEVQEIISKIMRGGVAFNAMDQAHIPARLRTLTLACLDHDATRRPGVAEIASYLSKPMSPLDQTSPHLAAKGAEELLAHANALAGVGKLGRAERLVGKVLRQTPGNPSAQLLLAQIRHLQGRNDEAAEILESVLPHLSDLEGGSEVVGELLANLSCYVIGVDPSRARKYALLALKRDPDDWQALGNLGEACRFLPREGHLEEGISACRKALALCTDDVGLKTTLGWLLLKRGDFARDFEELRRLVSEAMEVAGDHRYSVRFLLVELTTQTGELDIARACLDPMRGSNDPTLQMLIRQADERIAARARELGQG